MKCKQYSRTITELLVGLTVMASIVTAGCDNRTSITRSRTGTATFSMDMTVVRDFSQRRDLVDARIRRNGEPYTQATVKIDDIGIPSVAGGRYFAQSPQVLLLARLNPISIESSQDSYIRTLAVDLPDSFGITSINPQFNPNADNVIVQWSNPAGATKIALVVVAQQFPANNTIPLRIVLPTDSTVFVVPDTTFETASGHVVNDTYYIYLTAFNQGFGSYDGIAFPIPDGLPVRNVSDPSGVLRYGTVAPVDSILVVP